MSGVSSFAGTMLIFQTGNKQAENGFFLSKAATKR